MLNEHDNSDLLKLKHDSTDAEKALQEKLSRVANNAAKRVGDTQRRYDQEHGIFTK